MVAVVGQVDHVGSVGLAYGDGRRAVVAGAVFGVFLAKMLKRIMQVAVDAAGRCGSVGEFDQVAEVLAVGHGFAEVQAEQRPLFVRLDDVTDATVGQMELSVLFVDDDRRPVSGLRGLHVFSFE